jgi:hypothetical protein
MEHDRPARVSVCRRIGNKFVQATMRDPEEDNLFDELERDISRKDSLIALAICLGLGGWLVAATAMSVSIVS